MPPKAAAKKTATAKVTGKGLRRKAVKPDKVDPLLLLEQDIRAKRATKLTAKLAPAFLTMAELETRNLFAHAYVQTGSAAETMRQLGWTGSTQFLSDTGRVWLADPWVAQKITELRADMVVRFSATTDRIYAELSRIAFADIRKIVDETGELLPMNEIDRDTALAISGYEVTRKTFGEDGESVEKKVKFESKLSALDKLGKLLGLWKTDKRDTGLTPEDFLNLLLAARQRRDTVPRLIEPGNHQAVHSPAARRLAATDLE